MGTIKERQGHYYEVSLTTADGYRFTGKGKTEAAARAAAKNLAKKRGMSAADADAMEEIIDSLVGPEPRTFEANEAAPDVDPGRKVTAATGAVNASGKVPKARGTE